MILFPILMTKIIVCGNWAWPLLSITRRFCLIQVILLFAAMWALNAYWYMLICKGLKKLIMGVPVKKKKVEEKKD